jgi:class 3 adenylate cyclase
MAERAYPGMNDAEVRQIEGAASRLLLPILVVRRPAHSLSPPRASDPIMALVPSAERVEVPGVDIFIFGWGRCAAGRGHALRHWRARVPEPERTLAVVLFSDLAASTDHATSLGDERWKRLLDRHDEIARSCVARRGSAVIKTTRGGILATLPSTHNALRAALELRLALVEEGLSVRVGIHVGDIDRRARTISGLGVVIAARILDLAGPGEILASSTAVQAATGAPHNFDPRGEYKLKGVTGAWQLFALTTHAFDTRP